MKKIIIFAAFTFVFGLAFLGNAKAQSYTFNNDLGLGASGQDVVNLQTWLIANGYSIPSISSGAVAKGYFGSQTQAAVIAYQKNAGLPAYGFFGSMTRAYWASHNGNGGGGNQGDSLRVTSPNGGEAWQEGTTQNITWTSPYYYAADQYTTAYATINLVPYQAPCTTKVCPMYILAPYTIATTIPINQDSYNWNVGTVLQNPQIIGPASYSSVPDGQYSVQICQSGTSNCDSSDSTFTITSGQTSNLPDINIMSPNGGETWMAGTNQTVNVNITGYSSQPGASLFVFTYLVDSANHQTSISTTSSMILYPGNQSYQVVIPENITPGSYKILVDMYEPMTGGPNRLLAYDYSDNYFTVTGPSSYQGNDMPDLSLCPIGYTCTPTVK